MAKSGGLLVVLLCLASAPLAAILPPEGLHPNGVEIIHPDYPLALASDQEASARFQESPQWRAFLSEAGGEWTVRWDSRTGLPSLAWGSGIPWIPGGGNDLTWGRHLVAPDPMKTLQARAMEMISSHPALFPVDPDELVLNPKRSLGLDGGRYWQIEYAWEPAGLKAAGAYVFFRVAHGNLVQFGTRHILAEPPGPSTPALSAEQALAVAAANLGADTDALEVRDQGTLYFLPQADGEGLTYRLVWQTTFRQAGAIPTWSAVVDALTGELISFHDRNCYACDPALLAQGRVDGGVRPVLVTDPEEVRVFPFTDVETPGGTETTGFNGIYPFLGGGTYYSRLRGRYADIRCQGCSNPVQPYTEDNVTGDLHFGMGGTDELGNGTSTPADRTSFYHVQMVRAMGAKWLPLPWFDGNLRINTNIGATCNAWYDGFSVNFLRSGGGCSNTGENPGVIQHEWGHGLHANGLDYDGTLDPTPGFDGSYSEGLADHVSWLINHDPAVGAGFFNDGRPVRNVDEAQDRFRSLVSDSGCSSGGGYDGWEVHCGGLIWGQTDWEFKNSLVVRYGEVGGWYMMERLTFLGVPINETHVPDQPHSVYDGFAFLMDDDGDLANGIPDADILNSAYVRHEMASDPNYSLSATNACDPAPVAPALTALPVLDPAQNEYQVQLSWTAVPGANFYNLLRSEDGSDHTFYAIAFNLPAGQTLYVDDQVANRRTYVYRLQVVDNNGCVSLNDNGETAVVDLAELALENAVVNDDSGNGVLVPGEGADLPLEIRNLGGGTATAVSADLVSASPGVQVTTSTAAYPDLTGGTLMAPSGPPFRILVDPDISLCGTSVDLRLSMESAEGCWDSSFAIVIGAGVTTLGVEAVRVEDSATGNASGTLDPGETVDLLIDLSNTGPADSPATRATLIALDPGVTLLDDTADYGLIGSGATGAPTAGFQVRLDQASLCGSRLDFEVQIQSDAGCWIGTFSLDVGLFEALIFDDMETDTGWTVGNRSGDTPAASGIWERDDPQATNGGAYQPGNDHTPGAGVNAWVTGAPRGNRDGANDVDDGCTTVTSPVWDLSGETGLQLSYWRWYVNETNPDDPFEVEISNNGGNDWQMLESVPGTDTPWRQAVFDLDATLVPVDQVQVRFTACDNGGRSLTEALVDDLQVSRWVCDSPEPRAELVIDSWTALDNIPGQGNGDGILDPGESVEIALSLRNVRNAAATNVQATLSLVSGGGSLADPDATVADVPAGQTVATDAPHFTMQIDEYYPGCYGTIPLEAVVTYDDPVGSHQAVGLIELPVGGLGAPEVVFGDDFEGADDNGWTHGSLNGADDWERGMPGGQTEDPSIAVSGLNVWGNDLGEGAVTNGRYPANVHNFLDSPVLDLSRMGDAEIRFQRWLAVEEGFYDQASIYVNGGRVWQNPMFGDLIDTDWVAQQLDVSAFADGLPSVQVRFELVTDGGKQLGGWNIDDFELWASPESCTPLCSGPPTASGDVLRVVRNGEDIVLDWSLFAGRAFMNIYASDDPASIAQGVPATPVRMVLSGSQSNEGPASGLPPLTYFVVRSVNPCGVEE